MIKFKYIMLSYKASDYSFWNFFVCSYFDLAIYVYVAWKPTINVCKYVYPIYKKTQL